MIPPSCNSLLVSRVAERSISQSSTLCGCSCRCQVFFPWLTEQDKTDFQRPSTLQLLNLEVFIVFHSFDFTTDHLRFKKKRILQVFHFERMVQMVVVEKPQANTQTVAAKRKRRRKPRLTGISKQRQSANARERSRMRSIGVAMLQLRHCLPPSLVPKSKKLSKIQTLRLAIGYIAYLFEVLQHEGSHNDCCSDERNFNEEGYLIHAKGDEQETPNARPNYESKTDEWMCLSSESYSSDASG